MNLKAALSLTGTPASVHGSWMGGGLLTRCGPGEATFQPPPTTAPNFLNNITNQMCYLTNPKWYFDIRIRLGVFCTSPTGKEFLCMHLLVPNCDRTKASVGRVLLNAIISYLPHLSLIEINDTILFFLKIKIYSNEVSFMSQSQQ